MRLHKEKAPEYFYDFANNEQAPPTPISAPQKTNNVHILVTKLKIGTTLQDINSTFKHFGELEDITLFESGREAVVQFTYSEDAATALKEGAVHCAGKTVFLQPHNSAPTPSDEYPPHHYSTTTTTTRHHHQQSHDGGHHHGGYDYRFTTDEPLEYSPASAPSQLFHSAPSPLSSSNRYPPQQYRPPEYSSHSEERHVHHMPHISHHQSPPPKHSYHRHPHGDSLQNPSGYDNFLQQHNKKK